MLYDEGDVFVAVRTDDLDEGSWGSVDMSNKLDVVKPTPPALRGILVRAQGSHVSWARGWFLLCMAHGRNTEGAKCQATTTANGWR